MKCNFIFIQILVVFITFSQSITAQDKIPLKLPLGLSPDITPDSAEVVLVSRGWTDSYDMPTDSLSKLTLDSFYKQDFSIGGLEFEKVTLRFREGLLGNLTFTAFTTSFEKIIKCCQFLKETYNAQCLLCESPRKLGQWEESTVAQCENKTYKLEMSAAYGTLAGVYQWEVKIDYGTISFLNWLEAENARQREEWEKEEKRKLEKSKDDLK